MKQVVEREGTHLMQLHFFQAVVTLLFVIHVEDLRIESKEVRLTRRMTFVLLTLISFRATILSEATSFALKT